MLIRYKPTVAILVFVCMMIVSGCEDGEEPSNISPEYYIYTPPLALDDGIKTDSLENQGFDREASSEIARGVLQGLYREVNGVLIYRDGFLVLEEYFNGYGPDTLHSIRSATKSIVSLITGIAIEQNLLESVDVKVIETLDHYDSFDNWDAAKEDITVEHLLTMSSGIVFYDEIPMMRSSDWAKYTLDGPLTSQPGTEFHYWTGNTIVLGEVVRKASGRSIDDIGKAYLFDPLGIENFKWRYSPTGQTDTGAFFDFSARSMLKIGMLVLQDGMWEGKQIVSKEWIDKSLAPYFENYGYSWWRSGSRDQNDFYVIYTANGNGGNRIYIVPHHRLVVVVSASNYNSEYSGVSEHILHSLILPQLDN